ncbi:hypothetical protein MHU86_312 [Fragilaria crotonensis]|nr:hypothetical protein MHU86_312 [Fragilaria crotonensis]
MYTGYLLCGRNCGGICPTGVSPWVSSLCTSHHQPSSSGGSSDRSAKLPPTQRNLIMGGDDLDSDDEFLNPSVQDTAEDRLREKIERQEVIVEKKRKRDDED